MKTNLDQIRLSDYGLTEMNTQEMKAANGGGIIDGVWWALWGAVLNLLDVATPGVPFLKQLITAIVGTPPGK
ncbi:hypothetical protein [uncultured Chitinophaga sp.]|jgi:hypothetical protein|uniref:hypothetical protein n=1 Tax=uncultured Chitinophaga sp. TaxID=339340 RepID=UPI002607DBDC|nr:hypothetical protein [uncultured Chitinophaga sp.]